LRSKRERKKESNKERKKELAKLDNQGVRDKERRDEKIKNERLRSESCHQIFQNILTIIILIKTNSTLKNKLK